MSAGCPSARAGRETLRWMSVPVAAVVFALLVSPALAQDPARVPAVSAQAANVKDHGAIGDGVADDTAAIQAALNLGGPVFFPGHVGTVYTYRSLTLRTGNVLYGSATLRLRANQNVAANVYSITASGISRFGIVGLTFDGNKGQQAGAFTANGILIRGASDFRIQSTRWTDWHYDAIELTSTGQRLPIDANTPPDDPSDVIERGVITENIFRAVGRDTDDDRKGAGESYAIQIGSTVANLIVSNNEIIDCINGIIAAAYNRGIMITGNRIVLEQPRRFASSGIGVEQLSKHSVVANNTVIGAYTVGINVEAAQYVTVTGNVVNGARYGISAFGSTVGGRRVDLRDIAITGNSVTSVNGPAIRLVKSFNGSITGNVVTGGQFGIQIVDVAGAVVTGNHISGTGTGIGLSGSSDVTVTGNTVSGTSAEGLHLARGNARVAFFGNVSVGNRYGFYSEAGQTGVQLASNTFLRNSTRDVFIMDAGTNGVAVTLGVDSANRLQLTENRTALVGGPLVVGSVLFQALGNQADGTILYCSDCDPLAFRPCTASGPKTGAFAYRVNGSWKCQG